MLAWLKRYECWLVSLGVTIPCWSRVGLIAVLILLFVGCSRKTDLSGDVFVTMQSGDVKRAADAPLLVLPTTAAFEKERKALDESFQAAVQARRATIRAAKVAYDQASEEARRSYKSNAAWTSSLAAAM
jgi:hypothetical protein